MRLNNLLLVIMILSSVSIVSIMAQQPAIISIDANRTIGES